MCAVCFSAAQVVPLGALYARAKFVSMREGRAEPDTSAEELPATEPAPRDDVLVPAR